MANSSIEMSYGSSRGSKKYSVDLEVTFYVCPLESGTMCPPRRCNLYN